MALIVWPRPAVHPRSNVLASVYSESSEPHDWQETIRLMNQLDDLRERIDQLEMQRAFRPRYRDPFASYQMASSHLLAKKSEDEQAPSVKEKIPSAPKPVPVEEIATKVKPQQQALVILRPQTEKKKPRRVEIDKQGFSLVGLNEKQTKILQIIAKVPDYPTEYIRGTRYVRVGEKRYRDDCSNVLRIAYDAIGIDLFSEHHLFPGANGVRLIRKKGETSYASSSTTSATVGDIIVFDNTFDRNGNGRFDDKDTHAGIVVGVESDGTVALYNRVASGHRIYWMNLRHKTRIKLGPAGRRINNVLRRVKKSKRNETPRLTGQLFASYIKVIPG